MHVAALTVELRLRDAHSLKDKRALIKPIIDGAHRRFRVAVAEVGDQEIWQRSTIGVATVSSSASHAREVIDAVERFIWSFPEVEVIKMERGWMTGEDNG